MTAPSEPVRPADEETVQALAEADATWARVARAICSTYTGQHSGLPCEGCKDEAKHVVQADPRRTLWITVIQEIRAERDQALRERDEARAEREALLDEMTGLRKAIRTAVSSLILAHGDRAALRGDAEEASEPQVQGVDAPDLMAALRRSFGLPEDASEVPRMWGGRAVACASCGTSAIECEDPNRSACCCDACRSTGGCTHLPKPEGATS